MRLRIGAPTFALAAAMAAAGLPAGAAWAQAEPPIPAPAPAVTMSPAQLLAAADAAIDAGNLDAAAALYDQLAREHPAAPEANEARRALKIITVRRAPGPPPGAAAGPPAAGAGVVIRREPYSLRTSERLRLTTWEKLDFGTTAFLYGMSVGFSFALSEPSGDPSVAPVAIGALAYTIGAVAYLNVGEPDRGDLPLTLAITSFVPTTTLLVANIASDHPNQRNVALLTAGAGLLSVPVAMVAARNLELDPGDTQLVRDAGFWGLVLGTTGMLAFGGGTIQTLGGYSYYQSPSDRKVFTSSLLGLYGGLGLGALAAANSEISLERVRVATWGGYGGAVIGLLLGASADNSDKGAWRGVTVGALAGLVITFAATSALDGIPTEDVALRAPRLRDRIAPTLLSVTDADGRPRTTLGLGGRF
ncbi:MAG TPA: hypothetical protein VIF57_19690 [Polyangia bacterium]